MRGTLTHDEAETILDYHNFDILPDIDVVYQMIADQLTWHAAHGLNPSPGTSRTTPVTLDEFDTVLIHTTSVVEQPPPAPGLRDNVSLIARSQATGKGQEHILAPNVRSLYPLATELVAQATSP